MSRQSSVVRTPLLTTHDAQRTTTIGLLGGSFNPAHAGHRHISEEALKRLGLDGVWWLVSPQNPLKSREGMGSYADRFASALAQTKGHPRLKVQDIEQRMGLRYTVETILYLQARHPQIRFVWLMGADNLASFHRWRQWEQIAAHIPIAVLDRAPYGMRALHGRFARQFARARLKESHARTLAQMEAPAWVYLTIPRSSLSSTAIRARLASTRPD